MTQLLESKGSYENWQVRKHKLEHMPISSTAYAHAKFILGLLVHQTCCRSTYFMLSNFPNNLAK